PSGTHTLTEESAHSFIHRIRAPDRRWRMLSLDESVSFQWGTRRPGRENEGPSRSPLDRGGSRRVRHPRDGGRDRSGGDRVIAVHEPLSPPDNPSARSGSCDGKRRSRWTPRASNTAPGSPARSGTTWASAADAV